MARSLMNGDFNKKGGDLGVVDAPVLGSFAGAGESIIHTPVAQQLLGIEGTPNNGTALN